jgi:hypothetical protein
MPTRQKTMDLGIKGMKGGVGDHIAYFWETEAEFNEAVAFLTIGLQNHEHIVVFGHDDANQKVLACLTEAGVDWKSLEQVGRISVLGPESSGELILAKIGTTFKKAIESGAPLIRLLGNIGWGRGGWPEEEDILAFEAKVTGAASAFPCIVICMYDVNSLSSSIILHGAFGTHPVTIYQNLIRENPLCVNAEHYLARMQERRARLAKNREPLGKT